MKLWTTLIQGPIDKSSPSLQCIDEYKKYGDVVVSCYHKDLEEQPFEDVNMDGINVTSCFSPEIPHNNQCRWFNRSTFYYALTTMYNGVRLVKTPYVIKTRSDESWGCLDPFILEFNNSKSLVCGNIFCKKFEEVPFHFGDHIFVVKTAYLKKCLQILINICDEGRLSSELPAESVLCAYIMKSMNRQVSKEQYFDMIKIVDINKVKNFTASWVHAGESYKNSFINPHNVYSNNDLY